MAQSVCRLGGRFSRCHEFAMETCVYCGRGFCPAHTYRVGGHETVCSGTRCRRKHDDMAVHTEYRERVGQRNAAGLCGVEDCGPHPQDQCSLCRGQFCEAHVAQRMYPFRDGRVVIDRPASVCARCWMRRKIWRR